MIKLIKENFYRVWYNPYGLDRDEEDFMEVTAETEEEARRRVRSEGYVTSVEEIDQLTDTYNESKTRSKRNRLTEKSNFDDTQKAIDYYYPKWYYDDMSVNDIYDSLEKLGHSQDFIDSVIDGITERYEDEEDYELDESKMIHGRNKRLKEQVEDFEDTKDIVLVKSWLDDNGFDYEYIKSNQSASWFNINGQKRRIPRLDPKKNKVYSYMNNIRSLIESNVVGMGGGYPNVYLPKAAKEYLKRKGFQEVNTEIGPCFYMRFTGNDVWEIYIDEQYGGIYVVQEGYELRPTDDIATIDDHDYKDDIDAVINLGNCLANGNDFNSCLDVFFGNNSYTEDVDRKKNYFKEDTDLYHNARKAVYDFFSKKCWDTNIPEVANYAEGVIELLELDPEFATGEYTMKDWYKGTQINYPEDIEWLDSTAY